MKVRLYGLAFDVTATAGMPGFREGSVGGNPDDPTTVDVEGVAIEDEGEFLGWLLEAQLQKDQTVLSRIEEEVADGS